MLQAIIMRFAISTLLSSVLILFSSTSNSRYLKNAAASVHDVVLPVRLNTKLLEKILFERKSTQFNLGKTRKGRDVEAYYFPGTSDKKALIIGGMHGSELSSIEVAKELLEQLNNGDSIYYNVIIIPSLFPDNAETARQYPQMIGDVRNVGRYSFAGAIDPNRQMPSPGSAFDENASLDHAGRKIETENALLLELIEEYRPQRIVNLHAIRNAGNAGVFADPRTDHRGIALGYETDSSLAVSIAKAIYEKGGHVPGNGLTKKPCALYYKDPPAAPAGLMQKRNFSGSPMPGHRGGGVSLGTWAATAVYDEKDPGNNRDAIRILTIEFPGSKRPIDYRKDLQPFYKKQVKLYASALKTVFLGEFFVEDRASLLTAGTF